jgi:hypothetical protein
MIKILLNRPEPSVADVQKRQNFETILAAKHYQEKVQNPWRYWYFSLGILLCILLF